MSDTNRLDHCLTFINAQLRPPGEKQPVPRLAITFSRQTGAGAWEIATHLAKILTETGPPSAKPWTVFDRELVERVLKEHDLPAKLAKFMPEDKISYVQSAVEEVLGLHPPTWELVGKVTDTILRLAAVGNVILIGRGANLITQRLAYAFHVRLVGSLEHRVRRLRRRFQFSESEARAFIEKTDRGRQRYLKEYFEAEINDPLLYDLTINTDRVEGEAAARLIAAAALEHIGWRQCP